jgi:hypothetical protein
MKKLLLTLVLVAGVSISASAQSTLVNEQVPVSIQVVQALALDGSATGVDFGLVDVNAGTVTMASDGTVTTNSGTHAGTAGAFTITGEPSAGVSINGGSNGQPVDLGSGVTFNPTLTATSGNLDANGEFTVGVYGSVTGIAPSTTSGTYTGNYLVSVEYTGL